MLALTDPQTADQYDSEFFTRRVWHILTIDPLIPEKVAKHLERSKLWIYWPHYIVQVNRGRGQRRDVRRSVLHGYMPLAIHPLRTDTWDVVHNTHGVNGFLRDELGYPKRATEKDIEDIRGMAALLNIVEEAPPEITFKIGDAVRVNVEKICVNWVGIIFNVDDPYRIGVEVDLFGRRVKVQVPANEIEKID